MLKRKKLNYVPRILYPVKLSFRNEGELKIFADKMRESLLPLYLTIRNMRDPQVKMKGCKTVTPSHKI